MTRPSDNAIRNAMIEAGKPEVCVTGLPPTATELQQLKNLRRVATTKTTGVVILRYAPRPEPFAGDMRTDR